MAKGSSYDKTSDGDHHDEMMKGHEHLGADEAISKHKATHGAAGAKGAPDPTPHDKSGASPDKFGAKPPVKTSPRAPTGIEARR